MTIKRFLALMFLTLMGCELFAASGTITESASLIALVLSMIALGLTIYNTYQIRRNKKVHEVDIMNYKDDVNLTMEGIREKVVNDIRYIRKEATKHNRPNTQAPQQKKPQEPGKSEEAKKEQSVQETTEQSKPNEKRSNQKRRYHPHRRNKRPDQSQSQGSQDNATVKD